jgi:hypothetical protein
MRFTVDARLLDEARRYELRSACRDCLFYVRAEGRCAHGWPPGNQTRTVAEAAAASSKEAASVSFCKEFELA